MRSSPSSFALALGALALALAACGTEFDAPPPDDDPEPGDPIVPLTPEQCDESYLDYGNFAAAFTNDWCRGCHGAAVPDGMRQDAPVGVDFDNLASLREWKDRIAHRATGMMPTMPPAGGPSAEERALLAEWLACGARE